MITPSLRRAFLDQCQQRGVEPSTALEQAISDWLAAQDVDDDGLLRTALRGRPPSRTRRTLSAQLVQATLERVQAGQFSQRELADAIGVIPACLSQWLRGFAVPHTDRAEQGVTVLCHLVDVPRDCAFVILDTVSPAAPETKAAA